MACAGYVDYDPAHGTFALSDELAYFVASDGTDHYVGGLFAMANVLLRGAPKVAQAFRDGGGVAFAEFGPDGVLALDLVNRGQYEQRFASYWLKALPEVTARLAAGARSASAGGQGGCASRSRPRFRRRRSWDSILTANRSTRPPPRPYPPASR